MEHLKAEIDMKNVLTDSLNTWGKRKTLTIFEHLLCTKYCPYITVLNPQNCPIMFTELTSVL